MDTEPVWLDIYTPGGLELRIAQQRAHIDLIDHAVIKAAGEMVQADPEYGFSGALSELIEAVERPKDTAEPSSTIMEHAVDARRAISVHIALLKSYLGRPTLDTAREQGMRDDRYRWAKMYGLSPHQADTLQVLLTRDSKSIQADINGTA